MVSEFAPVQEKARPSTILVELFAVFAQGK